MNLPNTVITTEAVKDLRGRKTGEIKAVVLDDDGHVLISAIGLTKESAMARLLTTLRRSLKTLDGLGPTILQFRAMTMLVYPGPDGQWWYGMVDGKEHPEHESGVWETREEAVRAARRHLARYEWDDAEETSPFILNDEDQQRFTQEVREHKLYTTLREQGWTDGEAHHLVGGMGRLISTGRFAEMPPLPEGITV